jgi:3-hydroxyisobutyrate dehydrogenase-like beta-hydroxyacid dehydrogenase
MIVASNIGIVAEALTFAKKAGRIPNSFTSIRAVLQDPRFLMPRRDDAERNYKPASASICM